MVDLNFYGEPGTEITRVFCGCSLNYSFPTPHKCLRIIGNQDYVVIGEQVNSMD